MTLDEEIAVLESAINKGVAEVTYDGHTVKYASMKDRLARLLQMKRKAGTVSGSGVVFPEYSKGFY